MSARRSCTTRLGADRAAEYEPERILAVAGGLRFGGDEPEGAQTVVTPLGPQEQVLGVVAGVQAVGEVVQVGDEHHFNLGLR